jgi:hypothetical protein
LLALIKDKVCGAEVISITPKPTTSPVLIGELPSSKSPCDDANANTTPFVAWVDWDATHQFITYLPGSLNVISPVAVL